MNNFLAQSQVARFMVIVVGCIAIVAAMKATASILTPIFLAALFAVVFDIPRSWLVRRGMSDGMALLVTILVTFLLTLIFIILIGSTFINLSASLPQYEQQIESQLDALSKNLAQYGINAGQLTSVTQSAQTHPVGAIRFVLSGLYRQLKGILL